MRSDAQKKADKKYIKSGKCQYKTISARLHNEQAECIQKAAESIGVTQSKFLLMSALHCISHNIKFSENDTIPKKLSDLRTQHSFTPLQAATELGIDYPTYTQYESGAEKIPLNILTKICKLFNVPQSYFNINSDLVAIGNKGFVVKNTDSLDTLDVSSEEFQMLKDVLENYRKHNIKATSDILDSNH